MSEKKNSFSDWLQQEEAAMSIEIDSANDFIKVTHNGKVFAMWRQQNYCRSVKDIKLN